MGNNNRGQNDNNRESEIKGLGVSNQGQNLGGGKEQAVENLPNENGQNHADNDIGEIGDGAFTKTDQEIAQAAPGQTATNTNQGGSNI